jgi:hypothetical protein
MENDENRRLRPFTPGDYDAFAGVESPNPQVCYTARTVVLLDGATVEFHASPTADVIFAKEFPSPRLAAAYARVLVRNPYPRCAALLLDRIN